MRDALFNDDTLTFSNLSAGWLLRFDERKRKRTQGDVVLGDSQQILSQVQALFSLRDVNSPLTLNEEE